MASIIGTVSNNEEITLKKEILSDKSLPMQFEESKSGFTIRKVEIKVEQEENTFSVDNNKIVVSQDNTEIKSDNDAVSSFHYYVMR